MMFAVLSGSCYVQRFKHLRLEQIMEILLACNSLEDFFRQAREQEIIIPLGYKD
jgi:hypothetical protein